MTYTRIPVPKHTPHFVRRVVREKIDPRLADVHALLRLPLPELGIAATGHFTIATALFGVVEGVAAVLWPRFGGSRDAFIECMARHYSVEGNEPPDALSTDAVANTLLGKYRNPLQHSLGFVVKGPDTQGIREPIVMEHEIRIIRDTWSPSETQIESMERSDGWPVLLTRPTLRLDSDATMSLSVEALYVGARRLIMSVLRDNAAMSLAEDFITRYVRVQKEGPQYISPKPPPFEAVPLGDPSKANDQLPTAVGLDFAFFPEVEHRWGGGESE